MVSQFARPMGCVARRPCPRRSLSGPPACASIPRRRMTRCANTPQSTRAPDRSGALASSRSGERYRTYCWSSTSSNVPTPPSVIATFLAPFGTLNTARTVLTSRASVPSSPGRRA